MNENRKLKIARAVWEDILKVPRSYDQMTFGTEVPIQGKYCPTPMCVIGKVRQLFPKEYRESIKASGFFETEELETLFFNEGFESVSPKLSTVTTTHLRKVCNKLADHLLPKRIAEWVLGLSKRPIYYGFHGMFPEINITEHVESTMFSSRCWYDVYKYLLTQDQRDYYEDIYLK